MEKIEFKVAFQPAPNTPAKEFAVTKEKLVDAVNSSLAKAPVCVISKLTVYE